jgi:hypothetical protein
MGRGKATLIVAVIFLTSAGGAAVVIWQARERGVPLFYLIGGLMVVVGIGFSLLNWGVTDEYLRQHFGREENAQRMRETWRSGWVGALIGAAMIAAEYFLGFGR